MASSPETRPDGAADALPVDKNGPTNETSTEPAATSKEAEEPDTKTTSKVPSIPEEAPVGAPAETNGDAAPELPPLPNEPLPTDEPASPPPLPNEPLPDENGAGDGNDDGWDPVWSDKHQAWYFVNRFTQQTQWENPRVPDAAASGGGGDVGGYNPAIHGDYDPNAWYAKGGSGVAVNKTDDDVDGNHIAAAAAVGAAMIQGGGRAGPGSAADRYSHDAKAGRQLNNYFDVDAASNSHNGRSLKAERSGIKPSKSELKAFKEKRRARKEEKRRAWLRD